METVTTTQPQKRKTNGFHHQSVPADELWRMSVKQYHAMISAGVLTEDDPVELLEGWLVQKMPKPIMIEGQTVSEVTVSDIIPTTIEE